MGLKLLILLNKLLYKKSFLEVWNIFKYNYLFLLREMLRDYFFINFRKLLIYLFLKFM